MTYEKSVSGLGTCMSFGYFVPKTMSVEDYTGYKIVFNTETAHELATCSAYTRVADSNDKLVIAVPLKFYPERYRSETFFKKWEKEINSMGGVTAYKGIFPFFGRTFRGTNVVEEMNANLSRFAELYGHSDIKDFTDEWAVWEIPIHELKNHMRSYHTFCLIRYAYARHFTRVIDLYFDIKRKLSKTKPEPIEILQLALYSFDYRDMDNKPKSVMNQRKYYGTYSHHTESPFNAVYPIQKLTVIMDRMTRASLHGIFSPQGDRLVYDYLEVVDLIKQGKYKKVYELLRKK